MWMVDPEWLCRNHLLGEHKELHMLVGAINKNKNLKGYFLNGLIEIHSIKRRHYELSIEMEKRGYRHDSPLPEFIERTAGHVSINKSTKDLVTRCEECKRNFYHMAAIVLLNKLKSK